MVKIAIITNVIPTYREGFYTRIFSRDDILIKVYCQEKIPGVNITNIYKKFGSKVRLMRYISAKKEKISWQFIPWKEIVSYYDVVFIGGNPRVLSDAIFATYLRLVRKKVVLWTMAQSFRGNKLTECIRLFWTRFFKYIFVYTDSEVSYLSNKGFKSQFILGMNNGLDQNAIENVIKEWPDRALQEWRKAHKLDNCMLVLSCARLEPKNRFDQVIQALPTIIRWFPELRWCVIGGGSESVKLKSIVNATGLNKYVYFVGELYREKELAPWFLSSEVFIHPAAIGLSLMHAFGYGLPTIISDNKAANGPEYSAFESGRTGLVFRENDIQHLAETVIELLNDSEARKTMKIFVRETARERYNVDVMVDRFIQIARLASST